MQRYKEYLKPPNLFAHFFHTPLHLYSNESKTTPFRQKRKAIKKSNIKEIIKEKKKYYNSLNLQFLGTDKHYNSHDLTGKKKRKIKNKEKIKRKKKPKETKTGFQLIRNRVTHPIG